MKPLTPIERDQLHITVSERRVYRAGLADGFRRGVQAAAESVWEQMRHENSTALLPIVERIRALRPEEGK